MSNGLSLEQLEARIGLHSDPSDPDSIMQSGLPQLQINRWDLILEQILGRCSGPIRSRQTFEVFSTSGQSLSLAKPVETRFVLVLYQDGTKGVERFRLDLHGEWNDIRDTGLTPSQLLEQLMGFGEQEEATEATLFERERKAPGGSSRAHWQAEPKTNRDNAAFSG